MAWVNEHLLHHYNYWLSILIMCAGLYTVIGAGNFVKKLIGLAIFQTSVLLFYISIGYVQGARFPILKGNVASYINPLPHVLMLTAIVVGVATFAVGLALAVRVREAYGTIEEDDVLAQDDRPVHLPLRRRTTKKSLPQKTAIKKPVRKAAKQRKAKSKRGRKKA